MARKKKIPAHENHERWLVSYADFVTLLFATFVALFASSNADLEKLAKMSQSIQTAFNVSGPTSGSAGGGLALIASNHPGGSLVASILPGAPAVASPGGGGRGSEDAEESDEEYTGDGLFSSVPPAEEDPAATPTPAATPGSNAGGLGAGEGSGDPMLAAQLRELFDMAGLDKEVDVRQEARGTVISLGEAAFFPTGEVDVLPASIHKLDRIINALRIRRFRIRIEGHTDNTPITSRRWRDNLELSVMRAARICTFMTENYNYDPQLISPAGFGEFRPIADNATPEGRQKNRRIDIVILNEDSSRYEP